jgi:hypothetical protein
VTHVIDLSFSPFQIDEVGGAQIAVAIATVWVVGWAFRMLIRALNADSGVSSTSTERE